MTDRFLGRCCIVFFTALAVTLLQLSQTRIMSVLYWNHLVYFIISVALLGFGISGTWLTLQRQSPAPQTDTLFQPAVGFFISTLLCCLIIPSSSLSIISLFRDKFFFLSLGFVYLIAIFPFFSRGLF